VKCDATTNSQSDIDRGAGMGPVEHPVQVDSLDDMRAAASMAMKPRLCDLKGRLPVFQWKVFGQIEPILGAFARVRSEAHGRVLQKRPRRHGAAPAISICWASNDRVHTNLVRTLGCAPNPVAQ
jgi:hypothetical protein